MRYQCARRGLAADWLFGDPHFVAARELGESQLKSGHKLVPWICGNVLVLGHNSIATNCITKVTLLQLYTLGLNV